MYFEEFEVGQVFRCQPFIVTAEEIHTFASQYDPHPIHIDSHYANEHSIFNGIISSGFLTVSAVWGQWIRSGVFGNEFIVGKNFDYINFTNPVRANDELTPEIEIVGLRSTSKPTRGEVTIKFSVTNQKDEVVMLAQLNALLKTKVTQLEPSPSY
ncbi:MaoC/PaaZ C-terminal domain-containing protein [Niallia sp. XMNu-256]|uniref:MaoC/PaaZ C-terminal domain-containing protein n=1 Tax=Niallia sp. XMNu-256 TaxID=3082444 RepID=UPI0030D048E8